LKNGDSLLTALGCGATQGIVSNASSRVDRYHREDGPCLVFDHQSLTRGARLQLSNIEVASRTAVVIKE
jgi:hypothetical protein